MCEYCNRRIHTQGCPNAELQVFEHCECCDECIYDGEKYVFWGGVYYHLDCLHDHVSSLQSSELVEALGLQIEEAEVVY